MTDTSDADLMAIGSHCQFDQCNQLDFLPFKCSGCSLIFCQEHRAAGSHKCPHAESDVQVIICPVCALSIRLASNQDPDQAFADHQRSSCNPENYQKVHKKKKCSVKLCKEKLVSTNSITCKDCGALTCLKHRLAEDHKCPGPPAPQPSRFRTAFGSFFGSAGTNNTTTKAPAASTPSRMTSAKSRVTSVAKKASNSIQTQLQDYRASHKSKANPTTTTSATINGAATAPLGAEQCPQCGERFSTVQGLIDHASSAHSEGWSSGNNFPVRPSPTATGGNERCPHCSASFDDPVALVHHVESKHSSGGMKESEVCVLL